MSDFIYRYEALLRLNAFLGSFIVLSLWEHFSPKRPLTQNKFSRWLNNFVLVVSSTVVVRIVVPVAAVGIAYISEQNHWGLVNHIEMPFWAKVVITFVFLDLSIYMQHVVFHVVPLLWRFHRVHHSDMDCDVTTGVRFHPFEIVISIVLKGAVIVGVGAPPLAVIVFEIVLNAMSMFTHSNIRLNPVFEKYLRWIIVTPDMHRIHHSVVENETNSNFSFHISVWDRIFGTYIPQPVNGQLGMTVGLDQFREPEWQGVKGLLTMPFSTGIRGYAINYRDSKNEKELAIARERAQLNSEKAMLAMELASYLKAVGELALVSITDLDGNIIDVNEKFCEISGYSRNELIGQNHRLVNSGYHADEFFSNMWNTITSGRVWHGEVCNQNKQGGRYWVDSTIAPVYDADGDISQYLSVRVDITDKKNQEEEINQAYMKLSEANARLEQVSRTDALTGIANRRSFDEIFMAEISRQSRVGAPLTLIMCDIDYFKSYNDTYGHYAGDECIQKVARAIQSCFSRAGDLVARYGGEEFAIILPNVGKEAAQMLAERVRECVQALKQEHTKSQCADVLTLSVGVTSLVPDKNTSMSTIIQKADAALYQAKACGRNNAQYLE